MKTELCPLCGGHEVEPGWFDLSFLRQTFKFPRCLECGSFFCSPMPDAQTLERMYDSSYAETGEDCDSTLGVTKFDEVRQFLGKLEPRRLIDFGCGGGSLLVDAKKLGWDVLGIDYNPEFASGLKAQGIDVIGIEDKVESKADVLHLGDVLEHLTDMEAQLPQILSLLREGGILIAHGPLEGNPNLFFRLVKMIKKLRRNRTTEMPPYHVMLATTKGQRRLFERFRLIEREFRVTEVAWPAPETLGSYRSMNIRSVALFFARRVSQRRSSFNMVGLGNRYFYVGEKR